MQYAGEPDSPKHICITPESQSLAGKCSRVRRRRNQGKNVWNQEGSRNGRSSTERKPQNGDGVVPQLVRSPLRFIFGGRFRKLIHKSIMHRTVRGFNLDFPEKMQADKALNLLV